MKFVAEVNLDPDDAHQGHTVAAWLEIIARSVEDKEEFAPFDRRSEPDAFWKVVP